MFFRSQGGSRALLLGAPLVTIQRKGNISSYGTDKLVERQTLDILPSSSPGSSRFGARYIRASWRGWSAVGAAAAASWSRWVGRTVSGFVGTLNFRF